MEAKLKPHPRHPHLSMADHGLQIFTFGNIFSVTVKSKSWWWASPSQLIAYSFCRICSASHWTMMKGVFVGKFYPWSNIIHRLHGVTSLYSFHPTKWYSVHSRALVPDSECPHELVPSPLDLKAVGSWHYSHVTFGLPKVGWSGCLEYVKRTRRAGGAGREVIMHKLLALSCIIFSVLTACISTHRACAFLLNNSPRNARLANVAMNVCVGVCVCTCLCLRCVMRLCVKSCGCALAPPLMLHPPHQQGKTDGLHLVGLIFRSFRQAFWEA